MTNDERDFQALLKPALVLAGASATFDLVRQALQAPSIFEIESIDRLPEAVRSERRFVRWPG
jgi:hypothetical protein